MLHHIHRGVRESGLLPSIRSEHSQLFPSLFIFAAYTSFLFSPGAKLIERSGRGISLEKISLCSNPCPGAAVASSQPPSLADANCRLHFPAVATICCSRKEADVQRLWQLAACWAHRASAFARSRSVGAAGLGSTGTRPPPGPRTVGWGGH